MAMDGLQECVAGALPSYGAREAKSRALLDINGLGIVKGTPQ